MLPTWPLLDAATREAARKSTTNYVVAALRLAPLHVRLGVAILSIMLAAPVAILCLGAGGPGARSVRAERFYAWLQTLRGPLGSAVRLYRSMTVLAFFEYPAVAALLLAEPTEQKGARA